MSRSRSPCPLMRVYARHSILPRRHCCAQPRASGVCVQPTHRFGSQNIPGLLRHCRWSTIRLPPSASSRPTIRPKSTSSARMGSRVGASRIRPPTRSRMDRTLAPVPQASDFAPHGCAGGSGGDEAPLGRARPLEGALTRVVGRLALVLLGVAAGLATAETALRLFPVGHAAQELRGLHELRPDRPWLYGLRPGAEGSAANGVRYVVNADGFRDRRYARPKPPRTFRIVVLGDSIAFGYRVPMEDTFPKVLETTLAALGAGLRIEVLNLAVSGYNPYTEAALFADVGVGYQPDLVLVQFCVNDLNDPTLHFDAQTVERLDTIPDAAFPDPAHRAPPPAPSLLPRACARSRLCSLVVERLAPARPDPARLAAALATHDDPSDAEAGWVTIDLLPALREATARGEGALFIDLWHLTAAGHRVAAEALLAQLACRGLLPLPAGTGCPTPSSTGAPAAASRARTSSGPSPVAPTFTR